MDFVAGDAETQLVDAVIDAPTAWRTPAELAAALNWTLDATLDVIADLDAAGWLDAWDLVDGPAVTLSVAASERLGVRLVEVGIEETPRWARAGELDPIARRATGVFRSERMAGLELVADDRPNAEQTFIKQEEAEQAALAPRGASRAVRPDPVGPRPTLLIGTGLTPWPGPAQAMGPECPACRSARLPSHAYCLRCDRSGQDAGGPAQVDSACVPIASPRVPTTPSHRDDSHRRERERQRRQAKRKKRRLVQAKLKRPALPNVVPLWMAPVAG